MHSIAIQPIALRVLDDVAEIHGLAPEWRSLWSGLPCTTTFQSPFWLLPWMDVFRPAHPRLVELRCNGRLVGLIPLLIYQRDSQRVLAFMGGGISDYLDGLIDPEFEREALLAFCAYLQDKCRHWDILDLTDLPADSCLLRIPKSLFTFTVTHHEVCPVLQLRQDNRQLESSIPKKKRAALRNAHNRMARAGTRRVEVASTENILVTLDALFNLHSTRWATVGQAGVLRDADVQDFHRIAAPALVREGILRLYTLSIGDQVAALAYSLFEKRGVRLYLQAFNPQYAYFSPGTDVFGSIIEDAVKQESCFLDFLRGSESYKYSWGARDSITYRLKAEFPHIKPG
jgi:CelD/BcsL family acetyltransferase involved in cellulose biosynthesis